MMWIEYETTKLDAVLRDIARLKKAETLLHDLLYYWEEGQGFVFPDAKVWKKQLARLSNPERAIHPLDAFHHRIGEYADERPERD